MASIFCEDGTVGEWVEFEVRVDVAGEDGAI